VASTAVGKDERRLRRSSTMAGVGDGVVAVALPLLAANVTRDPLAIAAVVAMQHLPWAVVHAGWRYVHADRRTIVGTVDTGRAVVLGLIGFLTLIGRETILGIQLVALVVGLGEALTDGAETETADAGGLSARGMVGLAIGLPLGGVLYEIFPATPFLFEVLAFAWAALFTLLVKREVRPPSPTLVPEDPGSATPPGSGRITLSAAFGAGAGGAVLGVLVLYALDDLGLGAPAFGLLLACLALATIVGAYVAPEVGRLLGIKTGIVLALLAAAAGHGVASQVADPEQPWAGAVALGVAAGAGMIAAVLSRALVQLSTGRPATGPALERFHLAIWSAIPAGALAGGWLASRRSVHEVLLWAAGLWVAAALAGAVATSPKTSPDIV
jgi:hypothetical protein